MKPRERTTRLLKRIRALMNSKDADGEPNAPKAVAHMVGISWSHLRQILRRYDNPACHNMSQTNRGGKPSTRLHSGA